jgi:hypothetical protein
MQMIADLVVDFLAGLLQWIIPTPKSKLEKHIEELKSEEWFAQLLDDYRYSHIVSYNKKVKRFLGRPENIKILKSNEEEKDKFIRLVMREHEKFVR